MKRRVAATAGALLLALLAQPGTAAATDPAPPPGGTAAATAAVPGLPGAPEWWFNSWQVNNLWAQKADGRGITIAVIDTGVQADLPELQGKILPGADFTGNDSDGRIDFDSDPFSHGTAMASIMVGRPGAHDVEGLAPNAQILPISVPLNGVLRQGPLIPNATASAVSFAAEHGARVISMSLGGVSDPINGPDPCPAALQSAVLEALRSGSLVVAASGNSGEDGSPVEEPGVCLGVISVGSVNQQLAVSAFSSRHPYLTLTAPGEAIPSIGRDDAYVGDGTSEATALASAALALVWSKYPTESNWQILSRVLNSVTDRGAPGRDPSYGLGVINPEAAISPAAPVGGSDPVLAGVQPLLSLNAAPAVSPSRVPPAGDTASSLGQYRVGSVPSVLGPVFYSEAAGAGALALISVLLLVRFLRRRSDRETLYGRVNEL